MKYKGSTFEYRDERNADLLDAYKREIASNSNISLTEIAERIANSPSRRFWVSEERATIVISAMLKGDKLSAMNPTKREMFLEIYRRYCVYRKQHPTLTKREIIFHICNEEAPKWYLTPKSVIVLLHKVRKEARKKCYESRKSRLHFMFSLS